ncbi:MAG: alkyl sulfatase dimerization domain-containing protein, partial [Candidatus Marinimicrobia bacterium]|nr:alkyl sulfatase dimerization domain-containing protein [Candidatus Neomarinimicrobiota bacterium]
LPARFQARELVKLAGGVNAVLARAVELQEAGEHQLVCELTDVVISANPEDRLARIIKSFSLDYLGVTGGNINSMGFYRSAAARERMMANYRLGS